jgi:predicted NAD-dependent protein-ADP-ribosyltransferase YbiA (DUF1768 family)
VFLLSDQDRKDGPVRILITDIGQQLDGDGPVVTQQMHREALDYFQHRDDLREDYAPKPIADTPQAAEVPSIVIEQRFLRYGWPDEPGVHALRNEFPSPILVNGVEFPTVTHAYWSLSTTDADLAERIRVTDKPQDAHSIGEEAPRRANWPVTRIALMHTLLREKFTRHPPNADVLIATGDSQLLYTDTTKSFWTTTHRDTGRNWIGRLLELVRSELVAHREGPAVTARRRPRRDQAGVADPFGHRRTHLPARLRYGGHKPGTGGRSTATPRLARPSLWHVSFVWRRQQPR